MTNAVNNSMNLQCYAGAKRHSEKGELRLVEKWEEKEIVLCLTLLIMAVERLYSPPVEYPSPLAG